MGYDYIVRVGAEADDIASSILEKISLAEKDAKIKVKCDDSDIKKVIKSMSSLDKMAARKIELDINGKGVFKTLSDVRKETQETVDSMKKEFDELSKLNLDKNISSQNSKLQNVLAVKEKVKSEAGLSSYVDERIGDLKNSGLKKGSNEYNNRALNIARLFNTFEKKYKTTSALSGDSIDWYYDNIDDLKKIDPKANKNVANLSYTKSISGMQAQIEELQKQKVKFENLRKELAEYEELGIIPGGNFGADDYTGGSGTSEAIADAEKLEKVLKEIKSLLGTIDEGSGLQDIVTCINNINSSLEEMKSVISDVGDGQEFSPLLTALNELKTGISLDAFGDESELKTLPNDIAQIREALIGVKSVLVDVGDGQEFSPLLSMINDVVAAIEKLAQATNTYGKFAAKYYLDKVDDATSGNGKIGQTTAGSGNSSKNTGQSQTNAADRVKAIKEETQKILDAAKRENQQTKNIVGRFNSEYDENNKKFNDTLTGTSISTKKTVNDKVEHTKYTVGYDSSEDKVVVKKDVRAEYVDKEKEAQKELNSLIQEYVKWKREAATAEGTSYDIANEKIRQIREEINKNILGKSKDVNAQLSDIDEIFDYREYKSNEKDLLKRINVAAGKSYKEESRLEQEKHSLLQKNFTASAPEQAANNVKIADIEKSIQAQQEYRKNAGLENGLHEEALNLMNKKAQLEHELTIETEARLAKENTLNKDALSGESYKRETELEKQKYSLLQKNLTASDEDQAANRIRITNYEQLIESEQKFRQDLGLENTLHEEALNLMNKKAELARSLATETEAQKEKNKAQNKAINEYSAEDFETLNSSLKESSLADGSVFKNVKYGNGKGTITFIKELDDQVITTTVHIEDLTDALVRMDSKSKVFDTLNLKTDRATKNRKVEKDDDSLGSQSSTNDFMETYSLLKDSKLNGALFKDFKYSDGKGVITFIEELDDKVVTTTVHVDDLTDAVKRINKADNGDSVFNANGLKSSYSVKEIDNATPDYDAKIVEKTKRQITSLKTSFTQAYKGDDFAAQKFLTTINEVVQNYRQISNLKELDLISEEELSDLRTYMDNLQSVIEMSTLNKVDPETLMPDTKAQYDNLKESLKEIAVVMEKIKNGNFNTDDTGVLEKLIKDAKELNGELGKTENILANSISVDKLRAKIAQTLSENTKHNPLMNSFRAQLKEIQKSLVDGLDDKTLQTKMKEYFNIYAKIGEEGVGGLSIFSRIGGKIRDISSSFIAQYFSFQDIIRYIRNGITTITELDTAFTEMRKVSNESVQSLKAFQEESFNTASAVGTTAQQIQNSTADWMRLGETLEEAKKSAATSNILLNVSEFESIDDATESLVSMASAYDELDKTEIVDKLNNVGERK